MDDYFHGHFAPFRIIGFQVARSINYSELKAGTKSCLKNPDPSKVGILRT